ncbi:MAG: diaminopimelate decarboxylase [Methanosphaera sp.]|uniref:diaminopimelate decarboxylase n=1 Tax=Methanosphaera sp. TaxID=2666342 RepID=UPI0025F6F289|nr:diaminopimelate decarboxylase [Methanosphaera sp.]MCI5867800.1 diaminopimelate decarboxylase [Methanosphaera sp.]MDD6534210.1 diaminopimelate decarboxylase [Methanosphaera sp.]MDY3956406.1 diaminopimelate decarboxylase [Methanosphaera sp.]
MPYDFKSNLNIKDDHLFIGDVDANKLAEEYKTPLYVIDEQKVRSNYQKLYNAFSSKYEDLHMCYAAKANTSLAVMKILEDEGSYIDAVSPGEIYTALLAGFTPDRIVFTGNNVTDEELLYAHQAGVMINLDSISALERLSKIEGTEGKEISIRVNPMVEAGHHEHCITGGPKSKFGIKEEEAVEVYQKAVELGFKPVGMHSHIGSEILESEPFMLAVETMMDIAGRVHKEAGIDFKFLDFGGGFGIPYEPTEDELDLEVFTTDIIKLFREKLEEHDLGSPAMYIEPGRFLVGNAEVLLTRVNTIKNSYRKFAGVDCGFGTLLRPTMYGSYHHIVVANNMNAEDVEEIDIAGNLCESGDLFARDRMMPELKEGDLLAILNAGAYAYSMASQYNSRPRPAEVMVNGDQVDVIRKREKYSDLFNGQQVPVRLLK